jgi:hypothetical protein
LTIRKRPCSPAAPLKVPTLIQRVMVSLAAFRLPSDVITTTCKSSMHTLASVLANEFIQSISYCWQLPPYRQVTAFDRHWYYGVVFLFFRFFRLDSPRFGCVFIQMYSTWYMYCRIQKQITLKTLALSLPAPHSDRTKLNSVGGSLLHLLLMYFW